MEGHIRINIRSVDENIILTKLRPHVAFEV
jgi:hypothetical protein